MSETAYSALTPKGTTPPPQDAKPTCGVRKKLPLENSAGPAVAKPAPNANTTAAITMSFFMFSPFLQELLNGTVKLR